MSNTRDRLIQEAMDLFYRHGFHAVGLDRILAAVGVTKTTFYNHFESKDDLVLAVLERRDRLELDAWRQAVQERGGADPRARLLAAFDVLHEWFNEDAFRGCMFINAAAEFPSPHDPARKTARRHQEGLIEILREAASEAGASDPDGVAQQLHLLLEGAIVVRHVSGDDGAAPRARAAAQLVLEAQLS